MSDITQQPIISIREMLARKEVSPVEIVEAHLDRIAKMNPLLNAMVTLAPDAIDQARELGAELMRGETRGLLHGIPLTVKDTIDTAGIRTTAGSRIRANHVPSVDAPAVVRLKRAGAIIIGKTNPAEFALQYETDNPVFGRTSNPYDLARTAGGSSGGEAAAIASGMSMGGIGSDLMGSIRVPASFCGIHGLKPTTGAISCDGHVPAAVGALSLGAVIGPMARTVDDLALLFNVLRDEIEFDPRMFSKLFEQVADSSESRGMRAAYFTFDGEVRVDADAARAVELAAKALADAGLIIEEARPPGVEQGGDLWSKLFARAASNQLREFYAGREEEAGDYARFLLSSTADESEPTNAESDAALGERQRLLDELAIWMRERPLIIAPVGATSAFEHGARKVIAGGESISVFRAFSYSQTWNALGLPTLSVPVTTTREGMPIGVQLIARPFAEETLFAAARIIEGVIGRRD